MTLSFSGFCGYDTAYYTTLRNNSTRGICVRYLAFVIHLPIDCYVNVNFKLISSLCSFFVLIFQHSSVFSFICSYEHESESENVPISSESFFSVIK